MFLHPKLFSILACPKCKKSVIEDKEKQVLVCNVCHLQYGISDGIPIMLIEEARPLE